MFKKDISAGAKSKVKSSAQRGIRSKVLEQFPLLEPYIEEIMPKKEQLDLLKLPDRVALYTLHSTPLFFQHMDDPFLPHLTLVHKYPSAFPRLRIDRGAIRFVLSGATLMAPGLTSPGGRLPNDPADTEKRYGDKELEAGEVVVIEAEGKENACMVGVLTVGTKEMKATKKGQACEGDIMWEMDCGR
ncbi:hypothetical protein B0J11DRAFT_578302 [Dendryphion nanum]|uniref:Translation machinery-associated protein 20 n=1 Tax=Dendryphion nanum TaxID=256645 RepID=A0A9P9E4K5_9PLEO|nr:hypothetical protein B0J11DRAFT_578302 [Dendryphion nanum]